MRGLWGAVRPHAVRLVAAALAGVAAEVCGLALVATAAWLIARASQRPELAVLSVAIVAVRGFALAKGSLRYVERLAGHDATLRAQAELRGQVFDALAARRRADAGLRDGGALTRMVSDVEAVQDLLLRCVLPGVAAVVCGVVGVVVCGWVAPAAAVVLAVGVLVAGPVLASVAARAAGAGVAVQGCAVAAVAWAALGSGADQVGAAVAGLSALVAVEAVLPLAGAAQRWREVWPAVRRVEAVLAAPPAPRPSGPVAVPRGPLAVELLGVRVSYADGAGAAEGRAVGGAGRVRAALDGVDLRVERGRRVAVVGASGAGKSTLLAAVSGEVVPQAGAVLLGGQDAARYGGGGVGGVGGAVRGLMQDAHVFAGSVRANLLMARPDATDGELEAAARRARFLEVVRALPDGWDTPVGTGGHGLSGGQRQRLLLARALLADPPVLVLDEPAEALDPVMADAVVRDLLSAPGGGTLLLVTHRLAALDAADEVVVMDRGRVVQRGRHDELVAVPGPYRDLWDAELLAA
ncbi:ATP-binding cassette domain-containing protein [Spirillospora sp. NPDC046719]